MNKVIYGDFNTEGLEVIERYGKYCVRYDAGTHQVALREDELTREEAEILQLGKAEESTVILSLQSRLKEAGENPYIANWWPTGM